MLCTDIDDSEVLSLVPVIREVYEEYRNTDQATRYGFRINLNDVNHYKQLDILKDKYPNDDNLLRFMFTDRRDRGIHVDYPGCVMPNVLIFPVVGFGDNFVNKWWNVKSATILQDEYNKFIDTSKPFDVEEIHSHVIDRPCIFNPNVWHSLENKKKEFRVIARWWLKQSQ